MNILFITSSRIGDAILSTGLLSHLLKIYPYANITLAAGPLALPLFEDVPQIKKRVCLERHRFNSHWLKLWLKSVLTRWDIVVDIRGSATAYILCAKKRYIWRSRPSSAHRVSQLGRLLDLTPPPAPQIWIDEKRIPHAQALMGKKSGPILAIAPAANWIGKEWPVTYFIALVQALIKPGGRFDQGSIAIFAAAHERTAIERLIEAIPSQQRIDLVGKIDLLTAAACLKEAKMFIGNDSGLMHLSAAVGIPTLGLFGPSRNNHYAPWGPYTQVVRTPKTYEEIIQAPDFSFNTKQTLMTDLTVETVLKGVEELWQKSQR